MSAASWQPCLLIPVYEHHRQLRRLIPALEALSLPMLFVNDGSGAECSRALRQLCAGEDGRYLLELPDNLGKGAAVKAGLRWAREHGFSHALQIDADGQHDTRDVPDFLRAAQRRPQGIISGAPCYDADIPKSRYYGRFITQFWVCVNSVSGQIRDSMCGFRVYPVEAAVRLLDAEATGDRMDFDSEILVRWLWRGGDLEYIATRVSYPRDGQSHFQMWRDNLLISKMHARLFFAMLWRLPRLLKLRLRQRLATSD